MTLTALIEKYLLRKKGRFETPSEIIAHPEIRDEKESALVRPYEDQGYGVNEDGKYSNIFPEGPRIRRPINVNGDWVTELAYFLLPIADQFDGRTYAKYLLNPAGVGKHSFSNSNRVSAELVLAEERLYGFYDQILTQLGGNAKRARSCRVYVDACRYQKNYEKALAAIGLMPRDGFRWIHDQAHDERPAADLYLDEIFDT